MRSKRCTTHFRIGEGDLFVFVFLSRILRFANRVFFGLISIIATLMTLSPYARIAFAERQRKQQRELRPFIVATHNR